MWRKCDDCGRWAWKRLQYVPEDLAAELDELRRVHRIRGTVTAYVCGHCGMLGFVFEPVVIAG